MNGTPGLSRTARREHCNGAVLWTFADFGPSYAATTSGDIDLGLQADQEQSAAPLSVIDVDDLDDVFARVSAAGGVITRSIFAFPGRRRFHFRDPDGHELAVSSAGAPL